MDPHKQSIANVILVAASLGSLIDKFVFVGGAVTGLLVTDSAAPEARFTDDVDLAIEIVSMAEYYRLEDRLRVLGFVNSLEPGAPICRWSIHGTIVDIMPADLGLLGFNTRWYKDAIVHSMNYEIAKDTVIRLISAPYFIATKIEAWKDRANGDYFHRDLEDIISVIDGRHELLSDFTGSPQDVRKYIAKWFTEFLADATSIEAIEGHLVSQQSGRSRIDIVLQRIKALIVAG